MYILDSLFSFPTPAYQKSKEHGDLEVAKSSHLRYQTEPRLCMVPTMRSRAAWDAAPQEVLASIFKYLNFPSKIRVQFVCKAWSQALQQPHAGSWADEVILSRDINMHLTTRHNEAPLALLSSQCIIDWLSKRIRGVSKLRVHLDDVPSLDCPTMSNIFKQLFPDPYETGLPQIATELQGMHTSSHCPPAAVHYL